MKLSFSAQEQMAIGARPGNQAAGLVVVQRLSAALIVAAVLIAVYWARNWPLFYDAPLMHYIAFLMSKGFVPYRDIIDMNMPGTYLSEAAVMHVFGGGAFAWVCWDAFTGVVCILASAWIVGPGKRWAGVVAGGLAYLYHLSGNSWNLGQRDWLGTVLLLLAMGSLMEWVRREQPAWIAGFVMFCGFACSIKPLAALMVIPAVVALFWRREKRLGKVLLWAVVGAIPPVLMMAVFFSYWRNFGDFLGVMHGLVPYYAALQEVSVAKLFVTALPHNVLILAVGGAVLFLLQRSWRSEESVLLLAGVGVGLLSYVLQRKGWTYHTYLVVAFVLLWVMVEVDRALSRQRDRKTWYLAWAALAFAVLWFPVRLLIAIHNGTTGMETVERLEADLNELGGQQLSGSVQCLDMTHGGCINVLYRMGLVQATGFIYDYYLFPERETEVTRALQDRFLAKMESAPPRVIVLSSHIWPGDRYGYDEVSRWPAFAEFLESRYRLGSERERVNDAAGYRLYLLK